MIGFTNNPPQDYETYQRRQDDNDLSELILQQAEGILHNWAIVYCNRRERLGDDVSLDQSSAFLRNFMDEAVLKENRGVLLLGESRFRAELREAIISEYEFRWGNA
jgi:hypothetical protein